jgi:Ser/Thr protein kinase RdoA (MazF antagonist)
VASADGCPAGQGEGGDDDTVRAIVEIAMPGAMVTRRPSLYATSYRLEEIEARCPGEPTRHFMAKHLGREAMTEAGRRARPQSLNSTGRELVVYRDILSGTDLATPALIGGWADTHRGALVLERVRGVPLAEIGNFSTWEAAARWLARMHMTFASSLSGTDPSWKHSSLVHYDREQLRVTGRRGLDRAAEQRLGSARTRAAIAEAHERALSALGATGGTLVHGDFYPSNIVVAADRIAVVDWELAGWGAAELDLAALIAGAWGYEQRRALTMAYHQAASERGSTGTFAALMQRVSLATIVVALRWIGAAPDWKAPDDHHQDWFADAISVLDHLDEGAA